MDGFDTSFFFAFKGGHAERVGLFREVMEQRREAAVSTVTIFELLRHGHVGRLEPDFAEGILAETGAAFMRAGIDTDNVLRRAAGIAHGMGLAMADALVAASLEIAGCKRIHTADSDFSAYEGSMDVVWVEQGV